MSFNNENEGKDVNSFARLKQALAKREQMTDEALAEEEARLQAEIANFTSKIIPSVYKGRYQ